MKCIVKLVLVVDRKKLWLIQGNAKRSRRNCRDKTCKVPSRSWVFLSNRRVWLEEEICAFIRVMRKTHIMHYFQSNQRLNLIQCQSNLNNFKSTYHISRWIVSVCTSSKSLKWKNKITKHFNIQYNTYNGRVFAWKKSIRPVVWGNVTLTYTCDCWYEINHYTSITIYLLESLRKRWKKYKQYELFWPSIWYLVFIYQQLLKRVVDFVETFITLNLKTDLHY